MEENKNAKNNLKELFEGWNTIPNWLCFIRIALIPVFSVLFIKDYYIAAFIVMIVAALTDLFDGKIARKFNMVSNLGKILDPIADKLSQMAIVIILIVKFWHGPLRYVFFLFIVKELLMLAGGALLLSKGLRPTAAEMWGKVATTVFYIFMILIIAVGGKGSALDGYAFFAPIVGFFSQTVVTVMVVISLVLTFVSLFGYVPGFVRQLKEKKENAEKADNNE
ncbi:MAG: CDP-alcohol phosphatidyltransferase family protein [Ruminococcaceae bacterium]|nr:CDP-alcohol phosphatidyltransferase family protein [Oscillospiraceae bacterium]